MKIHNSQPDHNQHDTSPVLGILQWFHIGDYQRVESTVSKLKELGIYHLRTGISWADYHTKNGAAWYDWLMPTLSKELELLPCFLYTPPSIGIAHKTSSPPKGPKLYADFLDHFIGKYGEHFDWVELWNEPNNLSEYDYTLDSDWSIFSEMIILSSHWARQLGKKVALGGMSPIDCNWLQDMAKRNVLDYVDAIGIHGFPGSFDSNFNGWDYYINNVQSVLDDNGITAEIWISEAGYSTWQHDEKQQVLEFITATSCNADRLYWYSLYDLNPAFPTVDGFHLDEREYFFGLVSASGKPKLLFRLLEEQGLEGLLKLSWLGPTSKKKHSTKEDRKKVLITGGAGFVGVNLADFLLRKGYDVIIYDNLSRRGVEKNLEWLLAEYPGTRVSVEIADVRNYFKVKSAVDRAVAIYHFAAQVAVTTSLEEPNEDLEINVRGTFNVLEAIRNSSHRPPVFFTSTNKVYGDLAELELESSEMRYFAKAAHGMEVGVSEDQPLTFHSPYGSSKGAAEQYVLDYSRTFGVKSVVFRMSCIYGPHQFGTEDQGWVAHFLIQVLKDKPLHIYGDGKQVRDILFVEDLMQAFYKAWQNIDSVNGEAFNIGGGLANSISLLELIGWLEEKTGKEIDLKFSATRLGDQAYYVSNTAKFDNAVDWVPKVPKNKGLEKLYRWLLEHAMQSLKSKKHSNGSSIERPIKTSI